MKLTAKYTKTSEGFINVELTVIDAGDYPRRHVFTRGVDITKVPENEEYKLWAGDEFSISYTLPSAEDAKRWVDKQVYALRKHLEAWRAIQVPDDEEFWI